MARRAGPGKVDMMNEELVFGDCMRVLVRIAAVIAIAPIAIVRRVMVEAIGIAPSEVVNEVLLQSYLFAGF
ncbi:MAG TPA: hypothetical protein VIG47_15140, partial [Gemmatimonadaceae bacterium]